MRKTNKYKKKPSTTVSGGVERRYELARGKGDIAAIKEITVEEEVTAFEETGLIVAFWDLKVGVLEKILAMNVEMKQHTINTELSE